MVDLLYIHGILWIIHGVIILLITNGEEIFKEDAKVKKEVNDLIEYVNDKSHGTTVVIPDPAQTEDPQEDETENKPESTHGSSASSTISGAGKIEGATTDYNYHGQTILRASDSGHILYYINYARLYCNANADHNAEGFGFTAIYLVLVMFTIMFLFRYVKRVIYVAFLTMIAPLVALTYPLDKIKDGKAQAFNMWFREYMFNALIQPFHLIIYTMLVGSATNLAHNYPIYAVVAIAFLMPAEKLMRKFFGFDGAGTLSAAGSFAGGAIFSQAISRLSRPKPGKGGKDGGEGKKGIHMNRAPNSSGRVDADAVLTGAGTPQPTAIPTDAQARNAKKAPEERFSISLSNSTLSNSHIIGSDNGLNIGGGIGLSNGETMTPGGIVLPASANNIVGQAREAAQTQTANNVTSPIRGKSVSRFARLSGTGMDFGDYIALSGKERRQAWRAGADFRERNAANIASAVGGHIRAKAINGAKTLPKTAGRLVRRGVVGGIGGGALALTGAAVGAAAGSPGDAMKYALAGAGAGFYGTNYYGDKLANSAGETARVADEAFWNEQNKARQQYVSDEQFKNSEENIRMLAQFQGSMDAARESMGNGDVQAFRNEGFSDIKKIGRGLKLMEEYMKAPDGDSRHRGLDKKEALERAIAVAKWEDSAGGGLYETNSLAQQKFINTTKKQIMAGGVSDPNRAEQEVKDIIRDMSYYRFGV